MRNISLKYYSFIIIIFTLSCSPVYKTNYSFTPPKTQTGKACIFQCENNKLQCEQLEEMRYERCLFRADREYERCERNKRYRYKSDGKRECIENCWCSKGHCKVNKEICESRYRSCYQTCGGRVDSETICVSNCEKINQK